ncbi:MAG TPA: phosphoribosylformylglycinamidine cyclo-ligase [Gemmatimonadales bacterium]|nr:phosphoribosylformylglycinamidine cyclo-ligase [Gemmatimonadales bacterium]
MSQPGESRQYAAAGVDLAGAESAKERIGRLVAGTRTPLTAGRVGAFGGMVRIPPGMRNPTLVMSTDGVGTKVLVAQQAGRFDTVGECLVNHSVNDILVHGARPLAFMDYIAGAGLGIEMLADIVEGVARGCRAHGMDLAGGETAQMPGLYAEGHFDLAGTIVGVVEEDAALHGDAVVPGDVLLGYASSGLHTNGYTLARKIAAQDLGLGIHDEWPGLGQSVADAFLAVHRSYARAVTPVFDRMHALAHITGGGIPGNLVRVLPAGCQAVVDPASWEWPPIFRLMQEAGKVSTDEMRDVFNLGVGLIAVLPEGALSAAEAAAAADGVPTWVMGRIEAGPQGVRFTG